MKKVLSTLDVTHVIKYPMLSPRISMGLQVQKSYAGIIVMRVNILKGRGPGKEGTGVLSRVVKGKMYMFMYLFSPTTGVDVPSTTGFH